MEWWSSLIESFGWMHFWLILGVILGIVEIVSVAFFALPFALGAIITALFAWLDLPLNGQLAIFAGSSLVMLFLFQKILKKYLTSKEGESLKTNYEAMLGREVLVTEPIAGGAKSGTVKIGGEIWTAIAESGERFEPEDVVEIVHVSGARLTVAAIGTLAARREHKAEEEG